MMGDATNSGMVCIYKFYKNSRFVSTLLWYADENNRINAYLLDEIVNGNSEWFDNLSDNFSIITRKDLMENVGITYDIDGVTKNGHTSFLIIPMFDMKIKIGFVCLNSVSEVKDFDPEIIRLLNIIGQIFVNSIRRRDIDKQLFENKEKYRRIFNEIHDVYYETDFEGNILTVSPSAKVHLGYEERELVGYSIKMIYNDPGDRKRFLDTITENGFVTNYEILLKKKNGSIVILQLMPIWYTMKKPARDDCRNYRDFTN
ncbi:MAG: PAS domain S-box protein [Methanolobus sp.]